jgi:transcriptional regulator with XRE-family HTH domain
MMNIKRRDFYMLMRRKKKITHTEVANVVGVTQSAISQYELGLINLKKEKRDAYEQYIDNKPEPEVKK